MFHHNLLGKLTAAIEEKQPQPRLPGDNQQ